jgi:hypothetical protein
VMPFNPDCLLGQTLKPMLNWRFGESERALVISPERQLVAEPLKLRAGEAMRVHFFNA